MIVSKPMHVELSLLSVQDDCLQIGGVSLTRLVQRAGRTPCYIYDRQRVSDQVVFLRENLPNDTILYYALKANPMPAIVQHLASLVDGFDVASFGEMCVALDTGISPDRVSFAGPGKTNEELSCAIAAGLIISVESEAEMERVDRLGKSLDICPKAIIRINPDFEFKSSGMRMGGGAQQFGIDIECMPELFARIQKFNINFIGFHVFGGSQNLNVNAIQEMHRQTVSLCLQLAEKAPFSVRILNIGGGFGIPYFPGEHLLDLRPIGENLAVLLSAARKKLSGVRFIVELGRYIVGQAGIYVCRIIERKKSRGKTYLVTDGGMHHHLAASGNLGQVLRKNYPVIIGNKVQGESREIVSVVGPLCTPLDLLAEQVEMAYSSVGDLVVILQSGAYGLTASPVSFLSHPKPLELLI